MNHTMAFGDDHSPGADTAWDWIAGHRWPGWSLEIVTADPPEDMRPVEEEEARLHPWEPDDPRDPEGLGFDSVVNLRGAIDPRLALIEKPWDLVTIGPRGSGMLKSLHLGSTADWLLRQPVSPLLIARQPGPVRKVLVATDGSEHARRAVHTLASLPWLDGVGVHVVTVAERRFDSDEALNSATDVLSWCGADPVDTVVRQGRPTHAIVDEVEKIDPDLIVMGARGHGKIRRIVVGSTAAAIAGSLDRSMLVAHASEG
ncbi:MAG: universal stress protein [Actinomycetota bacterium]